MHLHEIDNNFKQRVEISRQAAPDGYMVLSDVKTRYKIRNDDLCRLHRGGHVARVKVGDFYAYRCADIEKILEARQEGRINHTTGTFSQKPPAEYLVFVGDVRYECTSAPAAITFARDEQGRAVERRTWNGRVQDTQLYPKT